MDTHPNPRQVRIKPNSLSQQTSNGHRKLTSNLKPSSYSFSCVFLSRTNLTRGFYYQATGLNNGRLASVIIFFPQGLVGMKVKEMANIRSKLKKVLFANVNFHTLDSSKSLQILHSSAACLVLDLTLNFIWWTCPDTKKIWDFTIHANKSRKFGLSHKLIPLLWRASCAVERVTDLFVVWIRLGWSIRHRLVV